MTADIEMFISKFDIYQEPRNLNLSVCVRLGSVTANFTSGLYWMESPSFLYNIFFSSSVDEMFEINNIFAALTPI